MMNELWPENFIEQSMLRSIDDAFELALDQWEESIKKQQRKRLPGSIIEAKREILFRTMAFENKYETIRKKRFYKGTYTRERDIPLVFIREGLAERYIDTIFVDNERLIAIACFLNWEWKPKGER